MDQKPRATGAEAPGVHGSERSDLNRNSPPAQRDSVAHIIEWLRPWLAEEHKQSLVALSEAAVLSANKAQHHVQSPHARNFSG